MEVLHFAPSVPGDMVWQASSPQRVVMEHQTPLAWAKEQVPRTSHSEITAPDIPWLRPSETDQVHVLHYGAEHRDRVDSYHHPRYHHSEGQTMQ